ncbi:TIGR02679 family protein [Massilia sp. DWR3-1-1]|uniref:TIGR02679 family protein n=1 Tax=Massilia sp. DWR3-1-1 TaxID=2804559 RepID=UPI003CE6E656
MVDHERLQRLLGGSALAPLRLRLRGRYERGAEIPVLTLAKLSASEREALCGLLGRRAGRAGSLRFRIEDMDEALRNGGLADSLREALDVLDGPIVDLSAQRAVLLTQWERVAATCTEPRLAALLDDARAMGMLKRLSRSNPETAMAMCQAAARVMARLPAWGQARSQLAADVLGDAHGLDAGRPIARLVLSALRKRASEAEEDNDETVREIWAGAGVMVNELARPALFLNMPGAQAQAGEPAFISLRALLRSPPTWRVAGQLVSVCENPNVVAIAADVLGARCAPLVCTDGMPAAAQRVLLEQLRKAGAVLRYHGDFDWPGIAIGNLMMRHFGAQPWRFGARDYETVVERSVAGRALGASNIEADWDDKLGSAMRKKGGTIDEEAVAADLLSDLTRQIIC